MSKTIAKHVMIANQMARGINGNALPSKSIMESFRTRHETQIIWFSSMIPCGFSAAVGAVAMKCVIKYGPEKVIRFLSNLKTYNFQGTNDPSHLLWKYLQKKQATNDVYRKSVTAFEAYCNDKTIEFLRFAEKDVFEWEADLETPKQFRSQYEEVCGKIGQGLLQY